MYLNALSPNRQREFIAGRSIARVAAEPFGIDGDSLEILKDSVGAPVWPARLVGSISHKFTVAGALVGLSNSYQSLGFDIEQIESLNENVWSSFASPDEIVIAKEVNLEEGVYANMIFSVKEALYKCLYPLCKGNLPDLSRVQVKLKVVNNHYSSFLVLRGIPYTVGAVSGEKMLLSWAVAEKASISFK